MLLSRVHKSQGLHAESIDALGKAKANQQKALGRVRGEGGGMDQLANQQEMMAKVCFLLGTAQEGLHEFDAALATYTEGLRHCESHERSLLAIARLQLRLGELDAAQQQVFAALPSNTDNPFPRNRPSAHPNHESLNRRRSRR